MLATVSLPTVRPLPDVVRCPLCPGILTRDARLPYPRWVCENNHGYTNVDVLLAELREQRLWPEP